MDSCYFCGRETQLKYAYDIEKKLGWKTREIPPLGVEWICTECQDKEEQSITKESQIKDQVTSNFNELKYTVVAIAEYINKNPEFEESVEVILSRYAEVVTTAVCETARQVSREATRARKEAFQEFKNMGLSDEHAVKLVCGQ